jgi:hypothetical protein
MNRGKGISGSSRKGEVVDRNRRRILEEGKKAEVFLRFFATALESRNRRFIHREAVNSRQPPHSYWPAGCPTRRVVNKGI